MPLAPVSSLLDRTGAVTDPAFQERLRRNRAARAQQGISSLLPDGDPLLTRLDAAGYDPNGNPLGTTGGLVPLQAGDQAAVDTRRTELRSTNSNLQTGEPAPGITSLLPGGDPAYRGELSAVTAAASPAGAAPAGSSSNLPTPVSEPGPAGQVLSSALGLDQTRQQFAAQRAARLLAANGALFSPGDSPEVFDRKARYFDLLNERAATGQPLNIGGVSTARTSAITKIAPPNRSGNPQVTQELAALGRQLLAQMDQPREIQVGGTTGILDKNGNFSRNPQPREPAGTQLAKLIAERDAAVAAGRPEIVAKYDDAIKNYQNGPQDKPLSLNEFWNSPTLSDKFNGDYGLYRQSYEAQVGKLPGHDASAPVPAAAPNPGAVSYLKAHPDLADQFDAKYGKGAAAKYLK